MKIMQSRRRFVSNAAVAGAAGFGAFGALSRGGGGTSLAAEPPPEISTIRLEKLPVACLAPQVRGRGTAACGGLYRGPVCSCERAVVVANGR